MIPRLSPFVGGPELRALLRPHGETVPRFEASFARTMGCAHGIAFAHGRSALHAFLQAMQISDAEVVIPAYTCSVVAHAVLLSGNRPRFVDVSLTDYNMELDQLAEAINERTRAVVPTHLFGYPMDPGAVATIVRDAESRYGHRIWIVQDCAHSYRAEHAGAPVTAAPDVALFGLNISKTLTSVFGGMLTTNDPEIATRVHAHRAATQARAGFAKPLLRRAYLAAAALAFTPPVYTLVHVLQTRTPFLRGLTEAYHLDEKIHFPPDATEPMLDVEAAVGLEQLTRYETIVAGRRAAAAAYDAALRDGATRWKLPPLVDGATYSHYVIRVPDRAAAMAAFRERGVEVGQLIEYSVPDLVPYRELAAGRVYSNAALASRHTINLPVHARLTEARRDRVIRAAREVME